MSPLIPFRATTGQKKSKVVVFADERRNNMLTLQWRSAEKKNWKFETLGRVAEYDRRGKITDECAQFALAAANTKSLELSSGATPAVDQPRTPFTIGMTEAAITDKDSGKYPHKTQSVDELRRSLRLAVALWGEHTPWESIDEAKWTLLIRRRLEALVAGGHKGDRATEITISKLITTVRWLRKKKFIPRDAAPWPDDWKLDVVQHWKGVTKSDRAPEPFRPRHTHEEAIAILGATGFEPRFQLLMWVGMELRLGQVVRARRTDLDLPVVDWTIAIDPEKDDPTDYGTFEVFGAGKKRGTVVDLTRGQRRMIDHALSIDGYLGAIEARYQAKQVENYRLFPSGYTVGRVGLMRGKQTKLTLSAATNFNRAATGGWIRKNFRIAEKRANVVHVDGRSAYGIRRVARDVAEGMSQSAIENYGSWTPGSKIANEVYLEPTNKAARREARGSRAKLRGESE